MRTPVWAVGITPLLGRPEPWECRSVDLTRDNVLGVLRAPDEGQTILVRVVFRGPRRNETIRLRMMHDDAQALAAEIAALLKRVRDRPIHFRARVTTERECEIYEVAA